MNMDYLVIDFEFVERNVRPYDLVCVNLYNKEIDVSYWLRSPDEKEQFIQDFVNIYSGYLLIGHYIHAECYSLLSLQDERIWNVYDKLKWVDTYREAKLIYNVDNKLFTVPLSLANLVKKHDIFDYGQWKNDVRDIIIHNTEYTESERKEIQMYCRTDCVVNYDLFFKLNKTHKEVFDRQVKLDNQIKRAEYVKSNALGTWNGQTIDNKLLNELKHNYYRLSQYFLSKCSDEVKQLFNTLKLNPTFKYKEFEAKAIETEKKHGFKWERTDTNRYSAESKVLKKIENIEPWIKDLRYVLKHRENLKLIKYDHEKIASEWYEQLSSIPTVEQLVANDDRFSKKGKLVKMHGDWHRYAQNGNVKANRAELEIAAIQGNEEASDILLILEKIKLIKSKSKKDKGLDEEQVEKKNLIESVKQDTKRLHSDYRLNNNLTWRNAPRATAFIPAMSAWLRCLMKPKKGYKLVTIDLVSAEIFIGAVLSGDKGFIDAANASDFYQYTAWKMGLCSHEDVSLPKSDFEHKHGKLRSSIKVVSLAVNYGATEYSVSTTLYGDKTEKNRKKARALIEKYKSAYGNYFRYADKWMDGCHLPTLFYWIGFRRIWNERSACNFPVQGGCYLVLSEITNRISRTKLIDKGVEYISPVHDEIILQVKDDELYSKRLEWLSDQIKQAFIDVLNPSPDMLTKEQVKLEIEEFGVNDTVYSKDPGTAKEILDLIKYPHNLDKVC